MAGTSKFISKSERLKKRNELIRQDFELLTKKKHLDSEHVVNEVLVNKYFTLEPSTIWLIVMRQGKYKEN
jgi:hypothetical protein